MVLTVSTPRALARRSSWLNASANTARTRVRYGNLRNQGRSIPTYDPRLRPLLTVRATQPVLAGLEALGCVSGQVFPVTTVPVPRSTIVPRSLSICVLIAPEPTSTSATFTTNCW